MPECALSGAALVCRRCQPVTPGNGEIEHYRCHDCGGRGFRILGPNGSETQNGGPAFNGPGDRRAEIRDADDGILIADGGERQLQILAYGRLAMLSDAEVDVYGHLTEGNDSIAAVASHTDCDETTVRTLLHRACRKLDEQPGVLL